MKHWANTYVFDHSSSAASRHGDSTATLRSDKRSGPQHPPAAESSRHESSHHNNSAHWSSIVDPYSTHGPAISVHGGKLCTFPPRSSEVSTIRAEIDPIRPPPQLPQQTNQSASTAFMPNDQQSMPPHVTSTDVATFTYGGIPADARLWYGQQKKSDWYGVTLRTNNKTPMQMLGYQSEQNLDDCSDQCSDINQKKSVRVSGDDCDQDSDIGVTLDVPNAVSLNTTVAQPNKQSRNGDPTSNYEDGSNGNGNGNGNTCFDCFFGLSWLRYVFKHNGNRINANHNVIQ